ncbi:glycine cleavage system protein GcvH [Saliphagus sp. GCM10025334]
MSFDVPEALSYLESHEWVRTEEKVATVGLTDFAQDELGDVVFVELPEAGTDLEQEAPFGTVESIKATSDLYSPVTGTVVTANERLETEPELLNRAPYGEGWLIEVDLERDPEEGPLLSADEYRERTG